MRDHVSVIPEDKMIYVDGEALFLETGAPKGMRALQWHNGAGHVEYADGGENHILSGPDDYAEWVVPFVALWEAEKTRLAEEENRPPTDEERRAAPGAAGGIAITGLAGKLCDPAFETF